MIKVSKLRNKKIVGALIATTMIFNNLSIFTFAQSNNLEIESNINESNNAVEITSVETMQTTTEITTQPTTEATTQPTTEKVTETTTEKVTETTTEKVTETITEKDIETTTEKVTETTTEKDIETTTEKVTEENSEEDTEEISEETTEISSEETTEEDSENGDVLQFGRDYFYEDLIIEIGNNNYNLIEGIEYDKDNYILGIKDKGGFDVNIIGTYTVEYTLISYSTKESVVNFTRTVTVVERTSSTVKFDLPILKIEKGTPYYNLLEGATAYTYDNEELELYIKDLRDFDINEIGIYTVLFGIKSDFEEYSNEEAERTIIVFERDEDLKIAENKFNVKTSIGEIISYNTLAEALKYETDLDDNLEIILSGEYTFSGQDISALSSNEKNLIIRGKDIAIIKVQGNLNFSSEYAKLENLIIEFSNGSPEINSTSTYLELIDLTFSQVFPSVNSTGILKIKNGDYEEIKSEKGIVYLTGESITINSKISGFKTLKISGNDDDDYNDEKLILNIGKIETEIETEEEIMSYTFDYEEIEKLSKDSIGTVSVLVDLNSDENNSGNENKNKNIFGEVSLEGNVVLILNETGSIINKLTAENENNLIMVSEGDEENVPIILRDTIDATRNIKIGILNIEELLKTSEGVEELSKQADEGKQYPVIKYELEDSNTPELLKSINSFDYADEESDYEKFEFDLFGNVENNIVYQTIAKNFLNEYLYIMRFRDEFFKNGSDNGDYTLEEIKLEVANETANIIQKESYDGSWLLADAIEDFMNKYKFNGNDLNGDNNLIILINENKFEKKDDNEEGYTAFEYIDSGLIEKLTQFGSEIQFSKIMDSPRILIAGTKAINDDTLSAKIKILIGNEEDKNEDYIFRMNSDLILKNIGILTPYDESEVTFYMGGHNFIANEGASVTPILSKNKLEVYNSIIDGSYENELNDLINSDIKDLLERYKGISIVAGTDDDSYNLYRNENAEITIETSRYFNVINIIGGTVYGDVSNTTINIDGEKIEISKIYAGNLGNGDSTSTINIYDGKIGTLYSGNAGNGDANTSLNIAGGRFVNLYTGNTEVVEQDPAARTYDLTEEDSIKVTLGQNHDISLASYQKIAAYSTRAAGDTSNILVNSNYTGGSFENLILNYNTTNANYRSLEDEEQKEIGFELNNVDIGSLYFENEENIKNLTVNLDLENVNIENFYINNVGTGNVGTLTLTFNYESADGINIETMAGGYAGGIGAEHGTYGDLIVENGTAEEFHVYTVPRASGDSNLDGPSGDDEWTVKAGGSTVTIKDNGGTTQVNGSTGYNHVYASSVHTIINGSGVRISNLYGGYKIVIKEEGSYGGHDDRSNVLKIENAAYIGNIYGGNAEVSKPSTSATSFVSSIGTFIIVSGGTIGNIYGGDKIGYLNSISGTYIKVTGGTINTIYGGGETVYNYSITHRPQTFSYDILSSINPQATITIDVDAGGQNTTIINGNIYGGSKSVNGTQTISSSSDYEAVKINIYMNRNSKQISVLGSIYGTGDISSGSEVIFEGEVAINIAGYDNLFDRPAISGSIYGAGEVSGKLTLKDVTINISKMTGSNTTICGGAKNVTGTLVADNIKIEVYEMPSVGVLYIANIYGGSAVSSANDYIKSTSITYRDTTTQDGGRIESIYGGNASGNGAIGSTSITIDNSYVKNVYGGNARGGNVGSTKVEIKSGIIYGNIYGGNAGSGDVTTSSVNIQGGTIYSAEIYGGSSGYGKIDASEVNITGGTFSKEGIAIYGGGEHSSSSTGTTTVNISPSSKSSISFTEPVGLICGGNKRGSAGDSKVNIENISLENISKICGGNAEINNESNDSSVVNSSVIINNVEIINDASIVDFAILEIYGGNYEAGSVGEKTEVSITNSTLKASSLHIFGGNYGTGSVGEKTEVSITNSTIEANSLYIFGGNYGTGSVGGKTEFSITNSHITGSWYLYVFGGNYGSASVEESELKIEGGSIIGSNNSYIGGGSFLTSQGESETGSSKVIIGGGIEVTVTYMYGGNCSTNGTVYVRGNSTVEIGDSSWNAFTNIYGGNGGFKEENEGYIKGSSAVKIEGKIKTTAYISIYGGNYTGGISDDSTVTISITPDSSVKFYGIYGGSYNGQVSGNSTVTIKEGSINNLDAIYGGSVTGSVGSSAVTIEEGSIDYSGSSIYGGSGNGTVLTGSSTVTIGEGSTVTLSESIYGGSFTGGSSGSTVTIGANSTVTLGESIYGGNNSGTVYGSSTVTIGANSTVTLGESIYGGNNSGNVTGSSTVTIGEGSTVELSGSIYGGNNINGSVTGSSTVTIKGTITSGTSIYGGNASASGTSTIATSSVIVEGGTIVLDGSIYGGAGGNTRVGTSEVTIKDGSKINVINAIYGGNAGGGVVTNTSTVTIKGESIEVTGASIYGGNAGSGNVGDSTVTIGEEDSTELKVSVKEIYGGSFGTGSAANNTTVEILSGNLSVNKIYGGHYNVSSVSDYTAVSDTSKVNISGGDIYVNDTTGITICGGSGAYNTGTNKGFGKTTNSTVNIIGGTFWNEITGIYGGSITGSTTNYAPFDNAEVNISGGTFESTIKAIYGGGTTNGGGRNQASVQVGGTATVNIKGVKIEVDKIYGGNYYGSLTGYSSVNIGEEHEEDDETEIIFELIHGGSFGGEKVGPYVADIHGNDAPEGVASAVNIYKGTIIGTEIFGGNYASGRIGVFDYYGNPINAVDSAVNIYGGCITTNIIFGGNRGLADTSGGGSDAHGYGSVSGNSSVNIYKGNISVKKIYGGNYQTEWINSTKNIHSVFGNSEVNIEGGTFEDIEAIYGGTAGAGVAGIVFKSSRVTIKDGTFAEIKGIYGGTAGTGEAREGSIVSIEGGTFGNIEEICGGNYGSGGIGYNSGVNSIYSDSVVSITGGASEEGPLKIGVIYGGNSGEGYSSWTSGTIMRDSIVNISGVDVNIEAIYGGSKQAGIIEDSARIILKDNTGIINNVYGASIGEYNYNTGTTYYMNSAHIIIIDNKAEITNIYGESKYEGEGKATNNNILGDVYISLIDNYGEITNVYGVSRDTNNNIAGDVYINLIDNYGEITNVYGGNPNGVSMTTSVDNKEGGNVYITLNNAGEISEIYGENSDGTGDTEIIILNSKVGTIVGKESTTTTPTVTLTVPAFDEPDEADEADESDRTEDDSIENVKEIYTEYPAIILEYISGIDKINVAENRTLAIESNSANEQMKLELLQLEEGAVFYYEDSSDGHSIEVENAIFGDGATIALHATSTVGDVYVAKTLSIGTLEYNNELNLYLVGAKKTDNMAVDRENPIIKFRDSTFDGDQDAFDAFVGSINLLNGQLYNTGIPVKLTGNSLSEAISPVIYFGYDTTLKVSIPTKLLFVGITDVYSGIDSPLYSIENNSTHFDLKVEVVGFEKTNSTINPTFNVVENLAKATGDSNITLAIEGVENFDEKIGLYPEKNWVNGELLGILSKLGDSSGSDSRDSDDPDEGDTTVSTNVGTFKITGEVNENFEYPEQTTCLRDSFRTIFKFTPVDDDGDRIPIAPESGN